MELLSVNLFAGSQAALSHKSALCLLGKGADRPLDPVEAGRLRAAVEALTCTDPFYGLEAADWPHCLLASPLGADRVAGWVVALAVTLQRLAYEWVGEGQVLSVGEDRTLVALPWMRRSVLDQALPMVLAHFSGLAGDEDGQALVAFKAVVSPWLEKVQPEGLAPNTLRFAHAAAVRGMPVTLRPAGVLQFGWGNRAFSMYSSFSSGTSNLATRCARNKMHTKEVLREAFLPVPQGVLLRDESALDRIVSEFGWPLVVKPNGQDQGMGVVANIRSLGLLKQAFEEARQAGPEGVIVEKHVAGDDHRILVVGGRMLMATRRINAGVTGDGVSTIAELVARENTNPLRGVNKRSLMIKLALDAESLAYLDEQGYGDASVPAAGEFVALRRTANISTGGTAVDVTAGVHPDNAFAAERAARLVGLDIAGVDFLCPDITRSWKEVGGAICEVNAQPGFRPHWLSDPARDINGEIIDWLSGGGEARVPVTLVLGPPAAALTDLLQRVCVPAVGQLGVSSASGIRIDERVIRDQSTPGYAAARMLLGDPDVASVILQVDHRDIVRHGHPCDRYGVAVFPLLDGGSDSAGGRLDAREIANLRSAVMARTTGAVVMASRDLPALAATPLARGLRIITVSMTGEGEDGAARFPEVERVYLTAGGHTLVHRVRGGARVLARLDGEGANGQRLRTLLFAVATAVAQGVDASAVQELVSGYDAGAARRVHG